MFVIIKLNSYREDSVQFDICTYKFINRKIGEQRFHGSTAFTDSVGNEVWCVALFFVYSFYTQLGYSDFGDI